MDYQTKTLDGFFKRLQKPLPITIIAINWLTFVAAGRDMIHGAFKLYSDRACHNERYDTATRCQVSRVDPEHPRTPRTQELTPNTNTPNTIQGVR